MDLTTSFEELMQRSPIPPHDMKSFLREMRRTPSGTVAVSKLLAGKIQSSSEAQAIHAFDFLESALESESEGSIEFRTEIGRYRFLNEIIRILSPKYLGSTTPEPVKERAVKFLEDAAGGKRKRWFPSEHSKVNSVYQSLVDGGIIQKPQKVADEDAEFQKSIFERGENAAILKRLLQSKDPSDLQAANRLIKNLVDEEARRNERRAELHSLIDRIDTSTSLLLEMLSQSNIDKEIVEELVDTCQSLRQKLGDVATETNDEVTSLLQASENIEKVLQMYENMKAELKKTQPVKCTTEETNSNSTAKFTTLSEQTSSTGALSLADELLMNLGNNNEIGDLNLSNGKSIVANSAGDNLLLNLDVDLSATVPISKTSKPEPVELFGEISKISREMMEQGLKGVPNSLQQKQSEKTPLSQIKVSTQDRCPIQGNSSTQPSSTVPMLPILLPGNSQGDSINLLDFNILESSASTTSSLSLVEPPCLNNSANSQQSSSTHSKNLLLNLDLENEEPSTQTSISGNNKDSYNINGLKTNNKDTLSISTRENHIDPETSNIPQTNKSIANGIGGNNNLRSPIDPGFCLNSVRELDLENIDLLEDLKPIELSLEESCKDVSLILTFGKYPGFPSNVAVAVITLTNTNKSTGLLNYVFQLLPPKGLQVKLLPPASMELPPWKKTFLPPPILTQVALIVISKSNLAALSDAQQPKVKYILSCCVEDETILHNGDFLVPKQILQ